MAEPIDISGDQMIDTSQDQFLPADVKPDYVKRVQAADQKKSLQDAQFRVQANDITKQPFWNGVVQKASMGLVPKAMDVIGDIQNDPQANLPDIITHGLPKSITRPPDYQGQTTNQDAYRKAAEASTGASMAGGLINPTNMIGGGALANAAVAMGQVGLEDVVGGRDVDPAKTAMAGGFSLAGSGITSAMTGGLTRFQDSIAGKLGPQGMKFVKDLARSILMKGTNVDAAYLAKLQVPGTSKIGGALSTAQDDAVYAVINEIGPSILKSQGDVSGQVAQNIKGASDKIGAVMDPIRDIPIDSNKLQGDMFRMSQKAGVQGPVAPDTQKWLEDAAASSLQPRLQAQRPQIQTFGQQTQLSGKRLGPQGPYRPNPLDPAPRQFTDMLPEQTIPMGQLQEPRDPKSTMTLGTVDEMSKGIESQMYDPMAASKLGIKNPQASGVRANSMLEDYIGDYMSPEGKAQFKQGNAEFARNKNAQQIMSPGLNRAAGQDLTASGFSTNPAVRTVSAGMNVVGKKMKTGLYQGTKGVAEYAVNRLNNRLRPELVGTQQADLGINKIMKDMAPFQSQAIARKFQTLAEMNASDAASYAYAMSMTDPTFRAIFTAIEKQMSGGSND